MQHIWGRGRAYVGFWWGNLRERDHLEDPGIDGRIILRLIFRKWDVEVWIGLVNAIMKCREFLDWQKTG
jgi:hypothetical protein